MDISTFEWILAGRIRKIKNTLGRKAAEYSSDDDRLHNFKASAKLQSESSPTTPAREAWGMAKKHIISVQNMVHSDEESSDEMINEKIGDAINYLIVIEAILKEKRLDVK